MAENRRMLISRSLVGGQLRELQEIALPRDFLYFVAFEAGALQRIVTPSGTNPPRITSKELAMGKLVTLSRCRSGPDAVAQLPCARFVVFDVLAVDDWAFR